MKKAWNIFKTALSWAVILGTLCFVLLTVITLRTVDEQKRNIFGYKMMIVQSDSMSATDFNAGDLIITKEVDPSTLKEGDIIAFVSRNSHNLGETVTHKIRSATQDENGWTGFVTYGTTTDTDDEAMVRYADVLGIYVARIRNMGTFFAFLRTPKGYILFILVPMLMMIFVSLFNCLRMYSGAQKQVEEEHRLAMEDERRKNEEMRQELEELRSLVMANMSGSVQNSTQTADVKPAVESEKKDIPKAPVPNGEAASEKKPAAPKTPATKGETASEKKPAAPKAPAPKGEAASEKKPAASKAPAPKGEAASEKKSAAPKAPALKAEASSEKKSAGPKAAAVKDQVPSASKTAVSQDPATKEISSSEKNSGRFAAAPGQKNTDVLLARKPNRRVKRPEGYDELSLDNIMAEFRPKGK